MINEKLIIDDYFGIQIQPLAFTPYDGEMALLKKRSMADNSITLKTHLRHESLLGHQTYAD